MFELLYRLYYRDTSIHNLLNIVRYPKTYLYSKTGKTCMTLNNKTECYIHVNTLSLQNH